MAILTPILLDKSAFGAYFLFGGLALGTVAVLAAYMPETRGRSLEEIQDAFHQPGLASLTKSLRRRFRRGENEPGESNEMNGLGNDASGVSTSAHGSMSGLRLPVAAA